MVEHDAVHFGVTSVLKVFDGGVDVVGGVEGHFLTGSDDQYFAGVAFPDRRSKTAADHVAQHIIKHHVRLPFLKKFQVFEKLERGDDTSPGAAQTRSRTSGLDAENAAEPFLGNVLNGLRIFVILSHIVHDRNRCGTAQQIDGGIRLRVTSDLNHFFAKGGKGSRQVAGNGGFPDAPFSVYRNL